MSQLAACNRLHAAERRLCRWLLMTHDRVRTDTFPVIHDVLGQMRDSARVHLPDLPLVVVDALRSLS